jgi:predicted hydrocarbon binding protein
MSKEQPINGYYYPNKMGRIVLLSLEEIIGKNAVTAILTEAGLQHYIPDLPPNDLNKQFGFDELSQIQHALEQVFGPRGGRGVALRAGRVSFKYGLRDFGPMLGFTDLAFRLSPLETKLQAGADIFANIFNQFSDQQVRVESNVDQIIWHIDRCPVCWRRHTDVPVCHLAVGILQESLYWVSGGKVFSVEETNCVAKGDPTCSIVIEKQALG